MAQTYVFVDGAYFTKRCNEFLEPIFQVAPDIDFAKLRSFFNGRKLFYYDAVDETLLSDEPEEYRQRRLSEQAKRTERIQAYPGVHVQNGITLGSKKKGFRQKEVDVMLAVDMLMHAFRQNMEEAVLIAGDRDFRPLVQSLMQVGTYVRLCYSRASYSTDLLWAADEGFPITEDAVMSWCTREFQETHQLPGSDHVNSYTPDHTKMMTMGTFETGGCHLYFDAGSQTYRLVAVGPSSTVRYTHPDRELLDRYVSKIVGPLRWTPR